MSLGDGMKVNNEVKALSIVCLRVAFTVNFALLYGKREHFDYESLCSTWTFCFFSFPPSPHVNSSNSAPPDPLLACKNP